METLPGTPFAQGDDEEEPSAAGEKLAVSA